MKNERIVEMSGYIRTGSLGLLISFLGSLPIGTLNLTAFYIASKQSTYEALWFALAVVMVELVVVRITLWGDKRISLDNRIFQYLLPIGGFLLLSLAISSFVSEASAATLENGGMLFPAIQSSFLLGILLSILNPMHVPFWMSWNKVLSSRNSLVNSWKSHTSYISGIGMGSMFGLLIFIFAGNFVFQHYSEYDRILNLVLGLLYTGFAFYLFILFYNKCVKNR